MDIQTLIHGIVYQAKHRIKDLTYSNLTGQEKKERLDHTITTYVENMLTGIKLNFIFKFVLKKLLIPNIPFITQAIFDLIKAKIEGITE